ncbi:MAG: alpha-glucosidase [Oscillospiraceae bacterium]|nr:alpha-glucosidase [Oscillospiraceae bacterium]
MFRVELSGERLSVFLKDRLVLAHTPDDPFVTVSKSKGRLHIKDGQWHISDFSADKVSLTQSQYNSGRSTIRFWGGNMSATFLLTVVEENLVLTLQRSSAGICRVWLNFAANPKQKVFGGGAQYETLNLRGKRLPMWVLEKQINWARKNPVNGLKLGGLAGSPNPQPVYVTEDFTFVYTNSPSYGTFDFRGAKHHRAEFWDLPSAITIGTADEPAELMRKLTRLTGRPAVLPNWAVEGAWLEIHGGMQPLLDKLEKTVGSGAAASALLIRDWTGERETSEGKCPFYDWTWNRELYPRLDKLISELTIRGVRVLAYINPHLSIEGQLFAEASQKGYLIKKHEGGNYITDMGGFMAGHLDLSNPDACLWYKELIKSNILALGFSGYYADMGAFLPDDAILFSKENPVRAHNKWPLLWSRLNRQAIREAGRGSDTVFIARTGFAGTGAHTMLATTGELNSGWGASDGLPAALNAALSLGMSGIGLCMSEVGGNVSFMAGRTKELFLRWLEWAAFTPVMYVVEGSAKGWQFDSDEDTLKEFSRMVNIHSTLAPFLSACVRECASDGMPVLRSMILSFPEQKDLAHLNTQYMLGDEMLVAPVLRKKQTERTLVLPEGYWVHLWTGRQYTGGETTVPAPIGKPPVFYRPGGKFANLFDTFLSKFG